MMKYSQTITLFGEAPPSRWRPSGFLTSMFLHGVAMALISASLKHMPKVVDPSERYTVRILNLRRPSPKIQFAVLKGPAHPVLKTVNHTVAHGGGHPAFSSGSRHLAKLMPAPQTLVQPDLPDIQIPQELPVPLATMWSTQDALVRKIIPPPQQEATNANVQPSLDMPNHELKLADLKVASSPFTSEMQWMAPSNVSPLTVRKPDAPDQVPQTGSQSLTPPTPARVMSLSDVLLQTGAVPLPMINETAPSVALDSLAPERPASPAQGGGDSASKQNGTGVGDTPGNQGEALAANGSAGQNGASDSTVTRITLPKDGHFGVVVVGSSPAEEYPEAAGVWTDRLAYTVYLHVGLSRSWILQYSLPRDAEAASAGIVTRPDAPWPYVVVRPHLAAGDTNGDAIMVHGLIDAKGHFEQLGVVFPQQFAQSQFVLSALQQWQFRPATQNGEITAVEVLLIIPCES